MAISSKFRLVSLTWILAALTFCGEAYADLTVQSGETHTLTAGETLSVDGNLTIGRVLIVDITGVPVVDTMVANHLIRMSDAVRLMGGESILTGISPATAKTIVTLGIDLSNLNTRGTLAQGLELAMEIVKKGRKES